MSHQASMMKHELRAREVLSAPVQHVPWSASFEAWVASLRKPETTQAAQGHSLVFLYREG